MYYDELDTIFGNKEKGISPWPNVPHALEIGNVGYDLVNGHYTNWTNAESKWDYLLSQGHRIHGTASDDSHKEARFAGWSVVYTTAKTREQLTLDDVMDSLFRGDFYSSQGPTINSIRLENEVFIVETDQPSTIEFISKGKVIQAEHSVYGSAYTIKGDEKYVRARVTRSDSAWMVIEGGVGQQRSAWTNPIWVARPVGGSPS